MIHFGQVDLDPAFQRDVVWSSVKMMGLIQSIFMVSDSQALWDSRRNPCFLFNV